MTEQELQQNLKSREWRLNHLYFIKDDQGQRVLFKLNWAQKYLLDNMWYLNIILKVRQLGITTFFCILFLDDCLFNGLDCGFIAHTRSDAEKIFDTKVRYAWDNLPENIKCEYILDSETARQLTFKQGKAESSIYVGTSLRSGTVQRLHLSELGTIDQKYPAKSEEIKSGALNTIHLGDTIVTIESTAKGQAGVFYNLCVLAMDNEKMGNLTPMDWKFFFLPWWLHPQYTMDHHIVIPRDMQDYFKKLEIEQEITLTDGQKGWYYAKSKTQGGAMKSEFPSTPAEAFQASVEGAYYGKQMDRVMEQKRICKVPWIPELPVDTWWDLGISSKKTDAMSIIFTQDIGLEIHIIDFYGNHSEGFGHYANVLKDKYYTYGRHHAPHDIEVKELGTGKTRKEMARKLGINFSTVEKLPLNDGIEAVRMVLSKCWFDEEKTAPLVRALKAYRKAWDDKIGKFQDRPLNDWSVDPADAFRMMAIGHKEHRRLGNYDEEEEKLKRIREFQSSVGRKVDVLNPFED